MKKLVLVKLGGSLITDKKKAYTARVRVMRRLGEEIKTVLTKDSNLQLVLVHGAGSFAHTSAEKYGTGEGFSDSRGRLGACKTHYDAAWINQILVGEFLKIGLAVASVSPSSVLVAKNRKLRSKFLDPVIALLNQGITPVLYGDVIWDEDQGCCIYSGEVSLGVLTEYLLKKRWPLKRIIFAGIENGVYGSGKRKIIPLISSRNFNQIRRHLGGSHGTDVTGGMAHKVEESLKLAKLGVRTSIIKGSAPGNLKRAIKGEKVLGTEIVWN